MTVQMRLSMVESKPTPKYFKIVTSSITSWVRVDLQRIISYLCMSISICVLTNIILNVITFLWYRRLLAKCLVPSDWTQFLPSNECKLIVHFLQLQTNIHPLLAVTIVVSYHPAHLAKYHPTTHPFSFEYIPNLIRHHHPYFLPSKSK